MGRQKGIHQNDFLVISYQPLQMLAAQNIPIAFYLEDNEYMTSSCNILFKDTQLSQDKLGLKSDSLIFRLHLC